MTEPAPWTLLFNRVKSAIPGAVDAMIRQEISALMVDFTQDTNIWMEEVPFTTVEDVVSYSLVVTSGTPHRLMLVYDPLLGTDRWAMNGISMRVPGTIYFARKPQPGAAMVAVIAKMTSTPQMDANVPSKPTGYPVIDSWIVEKYSDVFYYGTMGYLQSKPAKAFSDPQKAAGNAMLYNSQKARAKVDVQQNNAYNAQAWAFPQGWSVVARKGWT